MKVIILGDHLLPAGVNVGSDCDGMDPVYDENFDDWLSHLEKLVENPKKITRKRVHLNDLIRHFK